MAQAQSAMHSIRDELKQGVSHFARHFLVWKAYKQTYKGAGMSLLPENS